MILLTLPHSHKNGCPCPGFASSVKMGRTKKCPPETKAKTVPEAITNLFLQLFVQIHITWSTMAASMESIEIFIAFMISTNQEEEVHTWWLGQPVSGSCHAQPQHTMATGLFQCSSYQENGFDVTQLSFQSGLLDHSYQHHELYIREG